jgi:glycosyltransferase involved in cell wall biosynthesis
MIVIFISPGLLEAASKRGGGIEEIDLQVGLELSEDMEVVLVSSFLSNEKYRFRKEIKKGLTVEQLPVLASRNYPIVTKADTIYTQVMTPLLASTFFLRMIFIRKRNEMVCVVHNGLPGLAASVACRIRGIRVIFSEGNTIPWVNPITIMAKKKKIFQNMQEELFRLYGLFIAKNSTKIRVQSKPIGDGLIKLGVRKEMITIIPAGVNTHDYAPFNGPRNSKEMIFGYLGRLVDEKGAGFLLNVVQEMSAIHPEVKFVILGDGPYRSALEAYPNVIRTGYVKRSDLNSTFHEIDAFLFFQKELGLGELEAMSAGKVIVTIDTKENSALIENGVNGFLCKAEINSYMACTESLIDHRAELDEIGKNARNTILNGHSWAKVAEEWKRVIRL